MIDFCKGNNLFICNGRFGETSCLFTCKEASVIDYVIVSAIFVKHVFDFSVLNFCSMLSDAHCPLLAVFNCVANSDRDDSNYNTELQLIKKWDNEKSRLFVDNIDSERVDSLNRNLDKINDNYCEKHIINDSVETLCKIITDAAVSTFGTYNPRGKKKNDSRHKPWFKNECKIARKKYHRSKRTYMQNKNIDTQQEMKRNAKEYKKIMNKSIRKHRNEMKGKINKLKSNDPKEFWKIINGNQKTKHRNNIDINTLFQYFKDLNETDYDDGEFTHVDVNEKYHKYRNHGR